MHDKARTPPLVGIAILAYCLWSSFDMIRAWSMTPLERFTPLLFAIWCLPPLVEWFAGERPKLGEASKYLWGAAVVLSLLGQLGSLNAIKYVGLALAVVGFSSWSWLSVVWLLSAVAWMPAFGWLGSHFFIHLLTPLRLAIVLVGAAAKVWGIYSRNEKEGRA